MQGTYSGNSKKLKYLFEHATEVVVSNVLSNGTVVATLTVDGQAYQIKVPAGGIVVETLVETGTPIATITVGQETYTLKCPVTSEVEYTDLIGDEIEATETVGGEPVIVYHEPTYQIGKVEIDGDLTSIYAPPATSVVYEPYISEGTIAGRLIVRAIAHDPQHEDRAIVVDKDIYNIVVPSGGGGGGVADVLVNGQSVVTQQGVAIIDLTSYATDTELSNAVATLQANFQAGVDAIYNACVGKGSTPASHSLADVVDAIYAIGGNTPHAEITSSNTIPIKFSSSVTEGNT
jgi:hypothetical protein